MTGHRGAGADLDPVPITDPVPIFAALADESRWRVLTLLGEADRSASELAELLPISRQAITKHLRHLEAVGLVESVPAGRAVRFRALGARLGRLATHLETIGEGWDRRLDRLRDRAESAQDQQASNGDGALKS